MVPPHIRILFEECGGIVPKHIGIVNEHPPMRDNVPLEPILLQFVDNEIEPLLMFQSTQQSNLGPHGTPPCEL